MVIYRTEGEELGPEDLRGRIGLLAHQTFLHPDLTAEENLVFFARLYRLKAPRAIARQALNAVGLERSARRTVRTFSRGMAQRTALARALLHDPDVLLLDEPFAGLDRAGTDYVCRVIADKRQGGGLAVVCTHKAELAARIADRVVVVQDGRVTRELPGPADAAELSEFF
jgi:heme exporter protein A